MDFRIFLPVGQDNAYNMSIIDIEAVMATNVNLTPELEKFARSCVSEGRYNNVSEVVRQALRLLQNTEEQHRNFTAMLDAVRKEADKKGAFDLDDVLSEMDTVIDGQSR